MGTARRPCPCEDDNCPVESIMTLEEFSRHRGFEYRSLLELLEHNGIPRENVMSVMPQYENNELFSVCIKDVADPEKSAVAVLVNRHHPMAQIEEAAPGVPTWWWEEDLLSRGHR